VKWMIPVVLLATLSPVSIAADKADKDKAGTKDEKPSIPELQQQLEKIL